MTTIPVDTKPEKRGDRTAAREPQAKTMRRPAERALLYGVIFSFVFTALIWITGPRLDVFPHLPDQGASWYFWKLPQPDTMARLTAWGFYLSHQIIMWGLIWYAQTRVRKYAPAGGLHRVNVIALGVNALFIVLHYIQTHVWYDALAQDTSIWASQWSVILLLVWVMLMENNRRGVIFGKKLPIGKAVIEFARKYHGYYFAWAITFTFWFHPMEYTEGHLLGFFYTFLLMLQGSLFLTRIHVNKWWMFVQEIVVLAHGTIVAVVSGTPLWSMFFFGFFGVFIVTQMHGLGLRRWMKWGFIASYVVSALIVYSGRGFNRIWELAAIPVADYAILILMALLFGAGIRVFRFFANRFSDSGNRSDTMQPAGTD
jgi:hypothetical protein